MNRLELQYRLLMRAYPTEHRDRYEDEIVSTLLDVASDGQRRPKLREAAAIVTAGLGCRAQDSSELKPGLRIAGVVALAAVVAISAMAITLSYIQRPLGMESAPALSWVAVIAVSILGTRVTSSYRFIPPAAMSLAMVAAGASAMGLRRSTIVPAAIFLVLSALGQPARAAIRSAAVVVGLGVGSVLGVVVATDMDRIFQQADSPWVYVAQWDIASDIVPLGSPLLFVGCLIAAGAALLSRRVRFAIAATILSIPCIPIMLVGERGLMPYAGTAQDLALLATTGAALTLGASIWLPRLGHRMGYRNPGS